LNQNLFIFLSSTAASIVAIMGCCGFVMGKIEKCYEMYKLNQGNSDTNRRTRLQNLFGSFNLRSEIHHNTIQQTKESYKDLQPLYEYVGNVLGDMSISNYDLQFDEIYIPDLKVEDVTNN
jgi:hypothetical protein